MQQTSKDGNSILMSHQLAAANEIDLICTKSNSAGDLAYINSHSSMITQTITQLAPYSGTIGVTLLL